MANKPWPADEGVARFEDITRPVVDAIKQVYRLQFKGYRDVKWRGLDVGRDVKATSFSPDRALSAEMLKYDMQDQGRSPIQVLVGIAVQLGIEQGRRIAWESGELERKCHKWDLEIARLPKPAPERGEGD